MDRRVPQNTRTDSDTTPKMCAGISFLTPADLPDWSTGPHGETAEIYAAIRKAGYETIQTLDPKAAIAAGLTPSGIARIFDDVGKMREVACHWRDAGCDCTTVQLGTGFESDDEMARLAEGLLEIADTEQHPLYLETHRATLTQDIKRTLDLVARFPELRFNGDFAHWYIGHELPYGDMAMKFDRMRPIFERTRFLHLRVASGASGQVQASDPAEAPHLDFYRQMWIAAFEGFLANARPGDYIAALPELLPPRTGYPRMVPASDGVLREACDRWNEATFLVDVAHDCFEEARRLTANNP